MFRKKRGQSAIEYALVIVVAIAALLAVNVYMKKGMQGRLKESTDQIGRQWDVANFETYWKTTSSGTTCTSEIRNASGTITTNITGSETINRSEYDRYGNTVTSHY